MKQREARRSQHRPLGLCPSSAWAIVLASTALVACGSDGASDMGSTPGAGGGGVGGTAGASGTAGGTTKGGAAGTGAGSSGSSAKGGTSGTGGSAGNAGSSGTAGSAGTAGAAGTGKGGNAGTGAGTGGASGNGSAGTGGAAGTGTAGASGAAGQPGGGNGGNGGNAGTVAGSAGSAGATANRPTLGTTIIVDHAGNTVRQGRGKVLVKITGASLDKLSKVTLGSTVLAAVTPSGTTERTYEYPVAHGASLGAVDLILEDALGEAAKLQSALVVTAITASGKDAPGADTDNLDGSSSKPFRTVKQALAVAQDGDTVQLRGGSFSAGEDNSGAVLVPDGVTVQGQPELTGDQRITIDCGSVPTSRGLSVEGRATVRDLIIEKCGAGIDAARFAEITVERAALRGNVADGLRLREGASATVKDCTITKNGSVAEATGSGVSLEGDASATISGSTVANNLRMGITLKSTGGLAVTDTVIAANGAVGYGNGNCTGVFLTGQGKATFEKSKIEDNQCAGIFSNGTNAIVIKGSSVSRNKDTDGLGILGGSAAVSITGSTFDGNARAGLFVGNESTRSITVGSERDAAGAQVGARTVFSKNGNAQNASGGVLLSPGPNGTGGKTTLDMAFVDFTANARGIAIGGNGPLAVRGEAISFEANEHQGVLVDNPIATLTLGAASPGREAIFTANVLAAGAKAAGEAQVQDSRFPGAATPVLDIRGRFSIDFNGEKTYFLTATGPATSTPAGNYVITNAGAKISFTQPL